MHLCFTWFKFTIDIYENRFIEHQYSSIKHNLLKWFPLRVWRSEVWLVYTMGFLEWIKHSSLCPREREEHNSGSSHDVWWFIHSQYTSAQTLGSAPRLCNKYIKFYCWIVMNLLRDFILFLKPVFLFLPFCPLYLRSLINKTRSFKNTSKQQKCAASNLLVLYQISFITVINIIQMK